MEDLAAFLAARLDEDEAAWQGVADADYAGDPADAEWHLRDVKAKRAILDLHDSDDTGKFGSREVPWCLVCLSDREGYEEMWEPDRWPCLTLRHLAAVYSDHSDYRQEWKA